MDRPGIFSRIMNVLRRLPAAFREGYSKDPGIPLPESVAKRQKPPGQQSEGAAPKPVKDAAKTPEQK
jgi:hypothetical protein